MPPLSLSRAGLAARRGRRCLASTVLALVTVRCGGLTCTDGGRGRGPRRLGRLPPTQAAAVEVAYEAPPRQRSIDVYKTMPAVDLRKWQHFHEDQAGSVRHRIDLDAGPPIADPFALVADELKPFGDNIKQLVLSDNPVLSEAAAHFFEQRHGKRFRPTIVALLSRALPMAVEAAAEDEARDRQSRLGQITEMIHVASLIHDDVLDDADTRRGGEAIHKMYSNKVAVLAGDYLLARASVLLAKLQNTEVVEVMAKALDSLVSGEIMQIKSTNAAKKKSAEDGDETSAAVPRLSPEEKKRRVSLYARAKEALAMSKRSFSLASTAKSADAARGAAKHDADDADESRETVEMEMYLRKSYYKTASLICDASRSAALLAGHAYDSTVARNVEQYGYHLGLAFQIVDDVLDFSTKSEDLGKPAGADLQLGLATAPILYAALEYDDLRPMIERRFKGDGDVQAAYDLVHKSNGLELAMKLARWHAQQAVDAIAHLPPSTARDALISVTYIVLTRSN